MKPSEVLTKFGWCKREYAKDKSGERVAENNPTAVRFCAEGAIYRAYPGSINAKKRHNILDKLDSLIATKGVGCNGLTSYNDDIAKDKRYIIRLFKKIGE
jgi:hypothetical protein